MFRNYFNTAWRNLWSNKFFSAIKILGLSIGLTVCMLIFLYTKDEISFDRFHKNSAQLYRVTQTIQVGNNPAWTMGGTNAIVGPTFAREIPEIQQFVRVTGKTVTIKKNNEVFTENVSFADDNFFTVFTFSLVQGDKATALKEPHSIVLSKDMVEKYFGTEAATGKTIELKLNDEFERFTVTAVSENQPQNSTLSTAIVLPFVYYEKQNPNPRWMGGSLSTFLLLLPQASFASVENKMQVIFNEHTKEQVDKAKKEQGVTVNTQLSLQPLTAIHLSTEVGPDNGMVNGSDPTYSYILTCIGIFILIIACINFINLAVAQSLKRNKEIGIRKVVGGTRRQLVKQFLTESFLVSLVAFVIALLLMLAVLPFFNELANKKLSIFYLTDWYLLAGYFLLLLITAFISGFYPSLVLSAFHPVKVLYNKQKLAGKNYFTKSLVVLQFALTIFLIIGTIAINSQLNFLMRAPLGYNSKNLVRIDLPFSKENDNLVALFKKELSIQTGIVEVAARNGGRITSGVSANEKKIEIEYNRVNEAFLPTFNIPLVAGRNFSPLHPSDSSHAVIVNESFVKEAGWKPGEAIGKPVGSLEGQDHPFTIVGVIKDYHFSSLKDKISPEVFTMAPAFSFEQIWVKIAPGNIPKTLSLLEDTYKKLVPYFPYSYAFMDDINAKNYETEAQWKQIISITSVLFIFISCIGLLGLVMLSVEHRTKEIGIRKVLGAAVTRIVILIAKEFIALIGLAFLLAAPAGYYFINKWLQDFAYRITIGWWIFVFAAVIALFIALATISLQAIKAAMANPVKSLRS